MKHYIDATGEEWLRQFEAIRNAFLDEMRAAVASFNINTFRFCDSEGKEGRASVRNLGQAINHATFLIDDGFSFGVAVARDRPGVPPEMWISSWEEPQSGPRWPAALIIEYELRHDGVHSVASADRLLED